MSVKLYNGDCIDIMKALISKGVKVDAVITDPPYGTTPLKWDECVPVIEMWECIHGVSKPNTPIILFGQEPFSSLLRVSNINEYKYDWYWKKERLTNVFQVKRRPGKIIENVSVFYAEQPTYNPQKTKYDGPKRTNKIGENARFSDTQGSAVKPLEYHDDGTRFPLQIIECSRDSMYDTKYHPTQKPVSLMETLVKTYTNEGDTVLDFTMGSGSTGVACVNTNRNFIGIELDEKYYKIAEERINKVVEENSSKLW